MPPSRVPRRALSEVSKGVDGVQDSSVILPPDCSTIAVMSATARRTARGLAPRASSQPVTALGIALTPPGVTTTLPIVATQPCVIAASRAASTAPAYPSIASWRSSSRVVPAWLASPVKSSRHRPCGQMSLPTATGWSRSTRARPCSTCSSTKLPIRRRASSSRPIWCGSRPAALRASAIVVPSASVRLRARRAVIAPVMTREPAQATPNRAPSSSTKFTTPIGRDGWNPLSRKQSIAARALTTPSGPSKAPPSGTLSRCEPVTTPLSPGTPPRRGRPTRPTGCPSGPR